MAQRKKGPALFEVIRAAQQKQAEQQRKQEAQRHATPGALGTAANRLKDLGWLKSKLVGNSTTSKHEPVMREIRASRVEPVETPVVEVEPIAPVQRVETPVARPAVVLAHESAPTAAEDVARQVRQEIAAASRMKETYDDISPDPVLNNVADVFGRIDARDEEPATRSFRFPFHLSYSTGLAAGIGLLVVLGLVLVFSKIGSNEVKTLANQTPRPDVIENVKPPQSVVEAATPVRPTNNNTAVARPVGPTTPGSVAVESDFSPVALPPGGKRIIGLQYVVLMSFPPAAEADAKELVNFLNSKGVAVTAERGLPGYSQTWHSVITTTGFHKTKENKQYNAFIEPINGLMKQYAKGSKFKTFKPDVYTWRAAN
jgi:hypothetical protein